jgi:XTP/dITP diphosphohydrolase
MELVFATANQNKVKEIQLLLPPSIRLLGLQDINCVEDVPETSDTIEGNASQKAWYIYEKYNVNCFADDTGLEVDALQGRPGVMSARYAGPAKDAKSNMTRVLKELSDADHRIAKFKTVISLVINGAERQFTGVVEGEITNDLRGTGGFGYDPIFLPTGYDRTFAEMSIEEKNIMSHRARAVQKLVNFLQG